MDNQRVTLSLTRRGNRGPWKMKVTATIKRERSEYQLSGTLTASPLLKKIADQLAIDIYEAHKIPGAKL